MSTRPIALVTHRYAPAIGGVERVVEQLARGLARRGIAVEVLTTDPTGELPAVEHARWRAGAALPDGCATIRSSMSRPSLAPGCGATPRASL